MGLIGSGHSPQGLVLRGRRGSPEGRTNLRLCLNMLAVRRKKPGFRLVKSCDSRPKTLGEPIVKSPPSGADQAHPLAPAVRPSTGVVRPTTRRPDRAESDSDRRWRYDSRRSTVDGRQSQSSVGVGSPSRPVGVGSPSRQSQSLVSVASPSRQSESAVRIASPSPGQSQSPIRVVGRFESLCKGLRQPLGSLRVRGGFTDAGSRIATLQFLDVVHSKWPIGI